ncbi:MAG: M20 metallopeptidase family protein [Longimicrobiales bacterium]
MSARVPLVLALMLVSSPATARAQSPDLATAVAEVTPGITEIRHDIHAHPELGNREFRTAELVAEELRALGLDEVRTGVAHTGVVGVLRGGRPGPVVAVRADMDALPVKEETGYPFASTVRSEYRGEAVWVSHACGHDVHTAIGLGVARVLAGRREELPGTVLFVFQPAEEGAPPGEEGGAALMLEEGTFSDPRPEAAFALHTFAEMDVGRLGYTPGPAMAAADRWTATLRGQQAHGASPHLSVDPVVMAAQAVLGLQTIRSRNMDPLAPGVVTVGIIRGGERNNIIPMEVYLEGTVRTFDPAVQALVERRMGDILNGAAEAAGGSVDFEYLRGVPVTVNDRELSARMAPVLASVVGEDHVDVLEPTTGAEDFSYFANEVPSFYFRLGTNDPELPSGGHHTPTFRAADASIPIGIEALTKVVLEYLTSGT